MQIAAALAAFAAVAAAPLASAAATECGAGSNAPIVDNLALTSTIKRVRSAVHCTMNLMVQHPTNELFQPADDGQGQRPDHADDQGHQQQRKGR